jgi:prolyl-tRNA synthetase
MIHSDNKGLVLPPKVAQFQFVIIPIRFKQDDPKLINEKAHELAKALTEAGCRVKVDDTDIHNPGFKFNQYEL